MIEPHRSTPIEPRPPTVPGPDVLYRLLVEHVTDYAIFMLDPGGRVATWTEGAERMLGYGDEEILGQHFSIFYVPEEGVTGKPERDLQVASSEGRYEDVAWRLAKGGRQLWGSLVITALQGANGAIVGFGLITRDLTDRKEAANRYEESRQRYRSLFEHNPDSIASFGLDGTLGSANPATQELTGYGEDELLELSFWELFVSEDREHALHRFRSAASGEPQYVEMAITHRSGRRVDLRATLVPIVVEEEIIGVYCISEDITARKLAEAERELLLLRERVARAESESANRAKSDFLAVMSHELRTPLNVITGYAELLGEGEVGPLSPVQQKQVGRIRASASELLRMIEQVLAFARMESGQERITTARVDLARLMEDAAASMAPVVRDKGLTFEVEPCEYECIAETDADRLRQLLLILLSNAVKFTEHGVVRLGVRRDGIMAVFAVVDTGLGIAPEHAERIFEPFWQAEHPLVRRAGGAGLGLSMARRIAKLLGGEVNVMSTPGHGSTFTVHLPIAEP